MCARRSQACECDTGEKYVWHTQCVWLHRYFSVSSACPSHIFCVRLLCRCPMRSLNMLGNRLQGNLVHMETLRLPSNVDIPPIYFLCNSVHPAAELCALGKCAWTQGYGNWGKMVIFWYSWHLHNYCYFSLCEKNKTKKCLTTIFVFLSLFCLVLWLFNTVLVI